MVWFVCHNAYQLFLSLDSPIKNPFSKAKNEATVPEAKKLPGKKKPVKKIRKFRAASGESFVLLIGDEGAILVALKGNAVQSRQFVPDASLSNLEELRQTLNKNPKAPILLLVDTMDQSYVQQTLPPVSSMSVNKLIKRRLDRDFGSNDLKGSIILGREKSGRKDWNFLMIALEKSPQLTAWLDFILSLENRFTGIYLLSVETEILIRHLDMAMGKAGDPQGSEWKFFVSHNKVGGFRQVILRNGRIVFTRLAQPVGESNAEVIAGSIEQEMLSTIEYMKRLSFNQAAGLDVYIISSSAIKEIIDTEKFFAKNVHLFTPFEAAQLLNIEGATQPTDQFGDVILASLVGASSKHVLKFAVPQSRKVDNLFQMLIFQRALVLAGAIGLAGYMCYTIYDLYNHSLIMADLEEQKSQELKRFEDLRMEIKNSNIDVDRVSDIIDLYKTLREEIISPLPFIVKIHPIILSPVRIQSIDWSLQEATIRKKTRQRISLEALAADAATGIKPMGDSSKKGLPQMKADLTLEFPMAVNEARELQTIQKSLLEKFTLEFAPPFYKVSFAKSQAQNGTAVSDNLEISLGDKPNATPKPEEKIAAVVSQLQMTIEGDVIGGNSIITEGKMSQPEPHVSSAPPPQ